MTTLVDTVSAINQQSKLTEIKISVCKSLVKNLAYLPQDILYISHESKARQGGIYTSPFYFKDTKYRI